MKKAKILLNGKIITVNFAVIGNSGINYDYVIFVFQAVYGSDVPKGNRR